MAQVVNPYGQQSQLGLQAHDHAHEHQHAHAMGSAQLQPYTVVQTAHGPVQVPFHGFGQVGQVGQAAARPSIRIGTVLVAGAGLVFLGSWAYKKWFKGRGESGGSSRAREASEPRGEERSEFTHRREAKRSRSRLMAEFQRFLETNASEE